MTEALEDIDLSIIGRVEENIQVLTFRNKASVGIRKTRREKAFTQAIDIIIRSISYTLSENFKANPPIQFYGYAVLVMQDSTTVSIPIVSPRQRLYYGFQPEAFRQWQHWVEFYQQYQLHRFNDINLSKILIDSGLTYERQRPQLKQNAWVELPIREVYIKLRKESQFDLEFSQWQPIEFIDPINGVAVGGKSRQIDGDKDDGLPKNGIQPKLNPADDPFAGNDSPSSFEEFGQKGFDELDASKLGDADPNNSPTNPPIIYYVTFYLNDFFGSCNNRIETFQKINIPYSSPPNPALVLNSTYPNCGGQNGNYSVRVDGVTIATFNSVIGSQSIGVLLDDGTIAPEFFYSNRSV